MFALVLPAILSVVGLPPQPPAAAAFRADLDFLTGEVAAGRAAGSVGEQRVVAHLSRRIRPERVLACPSGGDGR